MSEVEVAINGRKYQIACDDGQEAHLNRLGEYVDRRVKELVTAVGQVGDSRLLVMVSLMIADELAESSSDSKPSTSEADLSVSSEQLEDRVSEIVDAAAARIEAATAGIAAKAVL
ncbi:MAG: cell division protein ZapA [Rhodospirillaceae bacterium]|nr:cell division protein ZapA [Rhodospirillaceae bacterium]|tara:strand:+ start:271 stop:615 length:345 start_codon:yes stop_codon:yes gene_type:complete